MLDIIKIIKKTVNARVLKLWGNTSKKKLIWDEEFASGQWNFLENTEGDVIYFFLNKYLNKGSILDLGCGSGNTIDVLKYASYTGVDISESGIQRALMRSESNFREDKNEYICADISTYVPDKRYDVILFRESIYYIPKFKIKGVLDRYANYLAERGVFIISIFSRQKYKAIVRLIEKHFEIVDNSPADDNSIILVFK